MKCYFIFSHQRIAEALCYFGIHDTEMRFSDSVSQGFFIQFLFIFLGTELYLRK